MHYSIEDSQNLLPSRMHQDFSKYFNLWFLLCIWNSFISLYSASQRSQSTDKSECLARVTRQLFTFGWCCSHGVHTVQMMCPHGVHMVFEQYQDVVQMVFTLFRWCAHMVSTWCSHSIRMLFRWCSHCSYDVHMMFSWY